MGGAHGRCELATRKVGTSWTDVCRCLNVKMAGRCASCRGTGGGCFHIKQNYCIHQHSFPGFDIQHSTFHSRLWHTAFYFPPPAKGWRSPSLSREGNVLHAFHWLNFSILVVFERQLIYHTFLCSNIQRWSCGSWSVQAKDLQVCKNPIGFSGRCLNIKRAGRCATDEARDTRRSK